MRVNIYIVQSRSKNSNLPTNHWTFVKVFLDKSEAISFVKKQDYKNNDFIICKQNDKILTIAYSFTDEGKIIKVK